MAGIHQQSHAQALEGVAHLVRPLVAAPACTRTPDAKTSAHLRAHARGAAQHTWGSRQHTWGSRQTFVQGRGNMLLRLLLPSAAVCEKHVVDTAECRAEVSGSVTVECRGRQSPAGEVSRDVRAGAGAANGRYGGAELREPGQPPPPCRRTLASEYMSLTATSVNKRTGRQICVQKSAATKKT